MELKDFDKAAEYVQRRRNLERDIELASATGFKKDSPLGVTIQGRYQDPALVDAVRDSVLLVLERRLRDIDNDLMAFGVFPPLPVLEILPPAPEAPERTTS